VSLCDAALLVAVTNATAKEHGLASIAGAFPKANGLE
jgi:hypothetical protein